MIWATVSSRSCFCWLYIAPPSLAAKNIINLISVLTIWWCPCVESSLVLLEEHVCYKQCVLLAKLLAFVWHWSGKQPRGDNPCPRSWQIGGEKVETMTDFIFWGSKITVDCDCSHKIKRRSLLGIKTITNLDRVILPTKVKHSQSYGVFSSHIWMWELGHKEGWALKNCCFRTVVLKKTLESPLDSKEIKPINPKGNQHWIFIGRIDDEAEAPILWPPDSKGWLIGKDPDAGNSWGQEEKGTTEDEMAGWPHWFNGHEFEQTQGDSEGQGSLVCCSSGGCKESDTT